MKQITCERVPFSAQFAVAREIFESEFADCSFEVIDHYKNVMINLQAMVLRHLESQEIISKTRVPRTWWDHFKLRFFPKRKINYKVINTVINNYRCCPHMKVDSQGKHIDFLVNINRTSIYKAESGDIPRY